MLEISEKEYLVECVERDRLADLHGYAIMGTDPEPRFDAIARAARTLLKTPMACISLVDADRHWFKSAIGVDIREIPRSNSFCSHTIMSNDVMIVPDMTQDARFAHNPFVEGEAHMRFYAGAPLITDDGFRIGALCVLDTEPRSSFTAEQSDVLRDLAALVMAQITARRGENSALALAGLAGALGQPMIAVGPSGHVEFANRPATDFFCATIEELQGVPMDRLLSAGRLGIGAQALLSLFQHGEAGHVSRPFKRLARRPDGAEVPVEISVSRWQAHDGPGIAIVLREDFAEISPREFDILSGEGAISTTADRGDALLVRIVGRVLDAQSGSALFFVSLDGFEDLSTNLGPQMGRKTLEEVSGRLRHILPEAIVMSRARDDDFAILVRGVDTVAKGYAVADRILKSFDGTFEIDQQTLHLTARIGFAVEASDAAHLVSNAAFALNTVRRSGGRSSLAYDDDLRARTSERHQVQLELMRALKNDEFRQYYQPQVCLKTGQIVGVEALLRWQHPARGLLYPQDFLFDVEEGNMSLPIGWWTLETALAQLAAWRREGLPSLRVGVNLFSSQFRSERLVPQVCELLSRYEIEPNCLELEVTEGIALLNDEVGIRSLATLRAMGVRIALDDFGTGYASLSSLQRFPLTTLKLDRGFIRDILSTPSDAVITRSMVAMANELRLDTVAEGIEAIEQEDFLKFLGCKTGQGYYYSKPMPAADISTLLVRQVVTAGRLNVVAYAQKY